MEIIFKTRWVYLAKERSIFGEKEAGWIAEGAGHYFLIRRVLHLPRD